MEVWYNVQLDEFYQWSENEADYVFLLGVDYIWFYICDL